MRGEQVAAVALWIALSGLAATMFLLVPWPAPALLLVAAFTVAVLGRKAIANAVNGLWLRRDPTLEAGHYVRVEGPHDVEGYVVQVGLRHTRLQTPSGDVAQIPNTTLANSIFTNFFLAGKNAVLIDVEAAAEPQRVVRLLDQEADRSADAIPGIVPGSQRIRTLPGRFPECRRYVMQCQPRNPSDRIKVRDDLQRRVLNRLGREGIRVPILASPPTREGP